MRPARRASELPRCRASLRFARTRAMPRFTCDAENRRAYCRRSAIWLTGWPSNCRLVRVYKRVSTGIESSSTRRIRIRMHRVPCWRESLAQHHPRRPTGPRATPTTAQNFDSRSMTPSGGLLWRNGIVYRGSIDRWIRIGGPAPLESLAKKFAPHLGEESFFELF